MRALLSEHAFDESTPYKSHVILKNPGFTLDELRTPSENTHTQNTHSHTHTHIDHVIIKQIPPLTDAHHARPEHIFVRFVDRNEHVGHRENRPPCVCVQFV